MLSDFICRKPIAFRIFPQTSIQSRKQLEQNLANNELHSTASIWRLFLFLKIVVTPVNCKFVAVVLMKMAKGR